MVNSCMNCKNLRKLTDWQHAQLIDHIKNNQYYLGEKLGHTVTWEDAEYDFFDKYIKTVGRDLRLTYCNDWCTVKSCPLRDLFNNLSERLT